MQLDGKVMDIKFLQEKKKLDTNLMISLHQNPSQLVITSVIDFKVLRKINLIVDALEIVVHPDKHRVFITVCDKSSKKYDLIEVELGFQKYVNDFDTLSMRD